MSKHPGEMDHDSIAESLDGGSPRRLPRHVPPTLTLASSDDLPKDALSTSTSRLDRQPPATSDGSLGVSARPPLIRARSQRILDSGKAQGPSLAKPTQSKRQQRKNQVDGDRTDALWIEMQATLAEVELSAARGTHFFGPEHSVALEELRAAQIALAQAWSRSEADETAENFAKTDAESGRSPGTSLLGNSNGVSQGPDEETAGDILLARKRREANDKYFWRVKSGVLDVVGKLEDVTHAMGKVERESREILERD